MNDKPNLYVFQWISDLGGADTRLKELIILLKNDFNITCIPNDAFRLKEKHNTDFLDYHGAKYCMPSDLDKNIEGFAYANCNFRLFEEPDRIKFIKNTNLTFLWSNDMMWTIEQELKAISEGAIDCCLFTSEFHKEKLSPSMLNKNPTQKTFIIENYFDADTWPYIDRPDRVPVFGKVSRDDIMKFSENFPIFYESACDDIEAQYKIMGWGDHLTKKYSWFNFDNTKWTLLKTNQLSTNDFWASIDIFLYNCNHRFIENQSRAVIESQLTGCPVIAPNKWNFPNMLWHTRTGFLYNDLLELKEATKALSDRNIRKKMGKLASDTTKQIWCDKEKALLQFKNLINYIGNK